MSQISREANESTTGSNNYRVRYSAYYQELHALRQQKENAENDYRRSVDANSFNNAKQS